MADTNQIELLQYTYNNTYVYENILQPKFKTNDKINFKSSNGEINFTGIVINIPPFGTPIYIYDDLNNEEAYLELNEENFSTIYPDYDSSVLYTFNNDENNNDENNSARQYFVKIDNYDKIVLVFEEFLTKSIVGGKKTNLKKNKTVKKRNYKKNKTVKKYKNKHNYTSVKKYKNKRNYTSVKKYKNKNKKTSKKFNYKI
jgi:hypothetical protein